jgi:hypothetical protein
MKDSRAPQARNNLHVNSSRFIRTETPLKLVARLRRAGALDLQTCPVVSG